MGRHLVHFLNKNIMNICLSIDWVLSGMIWMFKKAIYPVNLYSQHTYIDTWSFQIIQHTYIDSLHMILQPSNLDSSQIIHKTSIHVAYKLPIRPSWSTNYTSDLERLQNTHHTFFRIWKKNSILVIYFII